MNTFLPMVVIVYSMSACMGYDIFEGVAQQSEACFDVFEYPNCNTSIPEVFTPITENSMDFLEKDTKFWLFTYENQDKAIELHKCGGQVPDDSKFDSEVDTIFIVHGYIDSPCRTSWMREFKIQLFKRDKYNIILTDWTWGNTFDIKVAAVNALAVGQQMAFVIKNIMNKYGVNGDKFHLIGHSFGSNVVSWAGKTIKKWKKSHKLRRLTGLDPTLVFSGIGDHYNNIYYKDANFVDIIHTSAGPCFPISIGTPEVLGHVDFYPNGGAVQPSCYSYAINTLNKGDIFYYLGSFVIPSLCFHLQAIQFFKVTINPVNGLVIGAKCDNYSAFKSGVCKRCCKDLQTNDCAVAGMDAEKFYTHKNEPRQRRSYYYTTSDQCPFEEDYDFSIYKDC